MYSTRAHADTAIVRNNMKHAHTYTRNARVNTISATSADGRGKAGSSTAETEV